MRKAIFYSTLFIIVSVIGISIGFKVVNNNKTHNTEFEYTTQMGKTPVTDECVDEGQAFLQANAMENKVSPNAILVVKKYYPSCGHTTISYVNASEDIVNLSENQFKEKYAEWKIDGFSSNEIVISREEQGICNEHYLLQEEEGGLTIYSIDENDQQKLFQRTGIVVDYLPETDKLNLKNGIRVNGKENLNKILEDFE